MRGCLRLELEPGDEIHVSGPARLRFRHKTGRRATVVIDAEPDVDFRHVPAPEVAPEPLGALLEKALAKIPTIG
jgi:hypothetical protein